MGISGTLAKSTALAATAAAALTLWKRNPFPLEDTACLDGMPSAVESFTTEDGITLRLKRYVNEGAQPVLLAHGFTGNGLEFDLPHREHNLALFLAGHGYDVWISSFRGCGREPHLCGVGDWRHSVDHLAALDAPALVRGVTEATGRLPVWIGHSMGGIVLYMYLQGARYIREGGAYRFAGDAELAAERNASVLGGITIGSPPGLHRGGGDWIEVLERMPFFERGAASLVRYLDRASVKSPRVPVSFIGAVAERFPRLGRLVAMHGPIAIFLYNASNVDPDVGYSLIKQASDNVTTRMTAQIVALACDPDFKSYDGEYNYTANMGRITAPLFFITGTEDFVGPENVREYGHERVSSEVKRFENYRGYGHTDLVMGRRVMDEVYPDILDWLEKLAGSGA